MWQRTAAFIVRSRRLLLVFGVLMVAAGTVGVAIGLTGAFEFGEVERLRLLGSVILIPIGGVIAFASAKAMARAEEAIFDDGENIQFGVLVGGATTFTGLVCLTCALADLFALSDSLQSRFLGGSIVLTLVGLVLLSGGVARRVRGN